MHGFFREGTMKKILFKPEMVRQIIAGNKTQTRRIHSNMDKPRFKVGDIVYVGEKHLKTWSETNSKQINIIFTDDMNYLYYANCKWTSGMYMPEKYARLFLVITKVHKQKIIDISDTDAVAEGFKDKQEFLVYFKKLNPKIDFNQECYAYTFMVLEQTDKSCPKCGKKLFKSDLPDYDYLCAECDENFYKCEVK